MTTVSETTPGGGFLERYFGFAARGTTFARDTAAGATTFVVMSYIIFVNPSILSFSGNDALAGQGLEFTQVLTSTCLVAAVMSIMFNVVVLALWELNVGNIYADQRSRTPALSPAEALLGPRRRSSAMLAVGDPDLLAALAPHELEEVADRAARLQAYVMARSGDKKEDRFNGMLLVHTTQPEAAQRVVEELLEVQARRWRLAEIVPAEQGRSTLEYLLRLRDEFLPATLLDALKGRGSPPVDAAEYRSLRGLKKR